MCISPSATIAFHFRDILSIVISIPVICSIIPHYINFYETTRNQNYSITLYISFPLSFIKSGSLVILYNTFGAHLAIRYYTVTFQRQLYYHLFHFMDIVNVTVYDIIT